ncbi:MAG: ABC transporter substrate-binding protein [Bacteroidetes bacterium]|nr:ABC transporter substrate-binding protein [Bacteroidota bacterium]
MKMKLLFYVFLFLNAAAFAQSDVVYYNQPAEDYFLLGMRQYAQKDFTPALQSFKNSLSAYPNNHRTTAATIMEAKTLYALKLYPNAMEVIDSFLTQFPNSLYIEDACFTKGMCYYNLGSYDSAMSEMIKVFLIAKQPLNREHSQKIIEHLASEFLSVEKIELYFQQAVSDTLRSFLGLQLAEKYYSLGIRAQTDSLLARIQLEYLDGRYQQKYFRLQARNDDSNVVTIAALLPLQKNISEVTREKRIASSVLDGIQFAILEYPLRNPSQHVTVNLEIRDSERNKEILKQQCDTLIAKDDILAILGPLFSDQVRDAAALLQVSGIPLITPTATDDGLTDINQNIFQSNVSNSTKAKTLAQYVINQLGAKKIAILGSDAPASAVSADSFKDEVKRLGGEVVIDKRFSQRQTDLRAILKQFRITGAALAPEYVVSLKGKLNPIEVTRRLVSLGVRQKYIDSVLAKEGTINLTTLFGNEAEKVAASLNLPVQKVTVNPDSLQYPVNIYDVIFCPIARRTEIGIITSQLALYNIKGTIVGLTEWYDLNELEMNKRYADGVVFGSERYIEKTPYVQQIYTRFQEKYKRQMTDNELYGFDTMTMLLDVLNNGAVTREELRNALQSIKNFHGIRNAILFGSDRINSHLNILQYKDGGIKKIGDAVFQPESIQSDQ